MSKAIYQVNLLFKNINVAIYLSPQVKGHTEKYKCAKKQEYFALFCQVIWSPSLPVQRK